MDIGYVRQERETVSRYVAQLAVAAMHDPHFNELLDYMASRLGYLGILEDQLAKEVNKKEVKC